MPGKLKSDEQAFKRQWSHTYKAQENDSDGYDDFEEFNAHVAHFYRDEILRLRVILQDRGVDPDVWRDPIPDSLPGALSLPELSRKTCKRKQMGIKSESRSETNGKYPETTTDGI